MEFVIKTFGGLEDLLTQELIDLGLKKVEKVKRAVVCQGEESDIFKLNYLLRTGVKVLVVIEKFTITGKEDLYSQVKKIDWEQFLTQHDSFCIDTVMISDLFDHSNYPGLVTKDAIADFFKEKYYKRPNVNKENPTAKFNLHINNNRVTISLDTTGDSLFKRGYRDYTNEAPMNEVMAAGLILLSGWDKKTDFLDPMCGSGTILIEAAMMLLNVPAGFKKEHYAFMDWNNFKPKEWEAFKAQYKWDTTSNVKIIGRDVSARTVKTIAASNVRNAGFANVVSVEKKDFMKSSEADQPYHIVFNPPYDERLELENDLKFYEEMGTILKFKFKGSKVAIISSNEEAMKHIGLKPINKVDLENVKLKFRVNTYEVF